MLNIDEINEWDEYNKLEIKKSGHFLLSAVNSMDIALKHLKTTMNIESSMLDVIYEDLANTRDALNRFCVANDLYGLYHGDEWPDFVDGEL
jgi:hypothetical protein